MVEVRLLWSVIAATCVGCASHSANELHDAGAGPPPDAVVAAAGSSGTSSATAGVTAAATTAASGAASDPPARAAPLGGSVAPLSNAGAGGAMPAADGGQGGHDDQDVQDDPDARDAGTSGAAPVNRYACESDTTCQTHPNGDTLFTPVCDPGAKVCVECADPVQQQAMGARVITCLTLSPLRGLSGAALVVDCHRPCEE